MVAVNRLLCIPQGVDALVDILIPKTSAPAWIASHADQLTRREGIVNRARRLKTGIDRPLLAEPNIKDGAALATNYP